MQGLSKIVIPSGVPPTHVLGLGASIEGYFVDRRRKNDRGGTKIDLSVDGGINVNTAKLAVSAGANILVAGTAAFIDGPSKYARNIADLRNSTMSET